MLSIRDRIAANTSKLPSARDIDVSQAKTSENPHPPTTAIGMMGAMAHAKSRIQELERTAARTSMLPAANVEPNPFQPRAIFNDEDLAALVSSIEESVLVQPILVRGHPAKSGFYQIVVGERQFRACLLLGRTEIEAKVIDVDNYLMAIMAQVVAHKFA